MPASAAAARHAHAGGRTPIAHSPPSGASRTPVRTTTTSTLGARAISAAHAAPATASRMTTPPSARAVREPGTGCHHAMSPPVHASAAPITGRIHDAPPAP